MVVSLSTFCPLPRKEECREETNIHISFVMPAIFDSLVHQRGLSASKAWRVAFIVPFILITVTAIAMLLLCPDTPVGKWSERHHALPNPTIVSTGTITAAAPPASDSDNGESVSALTSEEKHSKDKHDPEALATVDTAQGETLDAAKHEVILAPTWSEIARISISPQTLALTFPYFCSFGGELAVNSILGSYYLKNFPYLGQTGSGRWAAMFGLLNVVTRPAGGLVGDLLYKYAGHSLWAKKAWIHSVGVVTGAFLIAIGVLDPHDLATMIGLIAGMAFFHEAGNGANFALVPHVHPYANGVLSGMVGATGNCKF